MIKLSKKQRRALRVFQPRQPAVKSTRHITQPKRSGHHGWRG